MIERIIKLQKLEPGEELRPGTSMKIRLSDGKAIACEDSDPLKVGWTPFPWQLQRLPDLEPGQVYICNAWSFTEAVEKGE